jgi:hypothetical protein
MSVSELDLLKAITQAQAETLKDIESTQIFHGLLSALLALTDGEYGFIGEVLHDDGWPFLRTVAISNIPWNREARRLLLIWVQVIGSPCGFGPPELARNVSGSLRRIA